MRTPLPNKTAKGAVFHLRCKACLLKVLLDKTQDHVKLPHKAINGIAQIIDRIDVHLNRQMGM